MLVLARKKGESIIVGDGIEITVLSVEGETVKVGISAPRHVEIHRKEIYAAIQQSNRDALKNRHNVRELTNLMQFVVKKGDKEG